MGLLGRLESSNNLEQELIEDQAEGKLIVRSFQDVEPILRHNRRLYNLEGGGWSPSREWRRVAQLPDIVTHEWLKKGINVLLLEDWPKVAAMLDHPDWKDVRTAPGRVSSRPPRDYYHERGGQFGKGVR